MQVTIANSVQFISFIWITQGNFIIFEDAFYGLNKIY